MEEDIGNVEFIIRDLKADNYNKRFIGSLENLLTENKKLKQENEEWQRAYQEEKDKQFELLRENKKMAEEYLVNNPGMAKYLNDNYIFKSKVKEILNKEELPLTIVGGRRNAKTLEYGRKLGRIEVCKELLREE